MNACIFCNIIEAGNPAHFYTHQSGLFAAIWDSFPATPGHALVVPTRHMQFFNDMTPEESHVLAAAVMEVKDYIRTARLSAVYETLAPVNSQSVKYIAAAKAVLEKMHERTPDAFNDGINDGPAAGQSVPHFHWHIMPRWRGDAPGTEGGIRHMFPETGNYYDAS